MKDQILYKSMPLIPGFIIALVSDIIEIAVIIAVCIFGGRHGYDNQAIVILVLLSCVVVISIWLTLELATFVEITQEKIVVKYFRGIISMCKVENVESVTFKYGSKGFAGILLEERVPREGIYKRTMLYREKNKIHLYPKFDSENDKLIKLLRELLPSTTSWNKCP